MKQIAEPIDENQPKPENVLAAWLNQMVAAGCPQELLKRVVDDCRNGVGESWGELSPTRQMRYARVAIWAMLEETLKSAPTAAISQAVSAVQSDELVMPGGPAKLTAAVRQNIAAASSHAAQTTRAAEQAILQAGDLAKDLAEVLQKTRQLIQNLEQSSTSTKVAEVQPGEVAAHPEKIAQMAEQVTQRWTQALRLIKSAGLWYEPWSKFLQRELTYAEGEDFMKSVSSTVEKLPLSASADLPVILGHLKATLITIDPGVRTLLLKDSRWKPTV